MTSHELANKLLEMPNVYIYNSNGKEPNPKLHIMKLVKNIDNATIKEIQMAPLIETIVL